ncbi:MAG: hypothetical protein Q8M94_12200, partial [Ignavibacteria bacterium]|nr:hypothetical protein [Ignavibacteria bacterium]
MVAYAIFLMVIIVCAVGLMTIVLNVAVNEIIVVLNPFITSGDMSAQFVTYWSFAIGLLIALPFLVLIALTAW